MLGVPCVLRKDVLETNDLVFICFYLFFKYSLLRIFLIFVGFLAVLLAISIASFVWHFWLLAFGQTSTVYVWPFLMDVYLSYVQQILLITFLFMLTGRTVTTQCVMLRNEACIHLSNDIYRLMLWNVLKVGLTALLEQFSQVSILKYKLLEYHVSRWHAPLCRWHHTFIFQKMLMSTLKEKSPLTAYLYT